MRRGHAAEETALTSFYRDHFDEAGVPPPVRPFLNAALHVSHDWLTRTLQVVTIAGVFDALGETPATADELARATSCNADALDRMLRVLASVDLVERQPDGKYGHNESSRALRSDHPMSIAAVARLESTPAFQYALAHLDHALRTGRPAVEGLAPDGIFPYLAKHPEENETFDRCMTASAQWLATEIAKVYDFSRFATIADIGGGRGLTLEVLLQQSPNSRGVLFDQPQVVAKARPNERMQAQGGDFFVDALPPADAYVLMLVLHDWNDDQSVSIVNNIRRAAKPGTTLAVCESLLYEGRGFHASLMTNVSMLALSGGRERTLARYEDVLARGGFKVKQCLATPTHLSVIEAVAV
jgi:hypothetical protein